MWHVITSFECLTVPKTIIPRILWTFSDPFLYIEPFKVSTEEVSSPFRSQNPLFPLHINGNLPIFAFIHLITNVILDGENSATKTDDQTAENAAVNAGSGDESSEDALEENFGIRRVRESVRAIRGRGIVRDGTRIIPLQQE